MELGSFSDRRVHLASDLHLGAPNAAASRKRERAFVAWLDGAVAGSTPGLKGPATDIHLVGDLFDFWFEYKRAVPKGGVRLMGAIAAAVDAGLPVHYHVGNHDLWTFGYLEEELGVQVHRAPVAVTYDNVRCLIGHGDGLGPGDLGYKRLKRIFTSPLLQKAFRIIHPDWGIALASRMSSDSRASNAEADATFDGPESEWLWQYAREVLDREAFDLFIFGHRHMPLDLEVSAEGRTARYINLGDWIHHFTALRLENGVLGHARGFEPPTNID